MAPVFVPLAVLLGVVALFKKQFVWGLLGLLCALAGFLTSPILLGLVALHSLVGDSASAPAQPSFKTPTAVVAASATKAASHIEFIPAASNQWTAINVNNFGWQQPWNVIQKTEKSRFIQLLGINHQAFSESVVVADWVERHGPFLVGSGCMAHNCNLTHGIFVINSQDGRAYAARIDGVRVQVWGVDGAKDIPLPIVEWLLGNGIKV